MRVAASDVTLNAATERVVFDDFVIGAAGVYTVTLVDDDGSDVAIAVADITYTLASWLQRLPRLQIRRALVVQMRE